MDAASMDADLEDMSVQQMRARNLSRRRLRKMRGAVWEQRTGGTQTMGALLLVVGVAAWGAWVWWNNRKKAASGNDERVKQDSKPGTSKQAASKKGSPFSFDKGKKGKQAKEPSKKQEPPSAFNAVIPAQGFSHSKAAPTLKGKKGKGKKGGRAHQQGPSDDAVSAAVAARAKQLGIAEAGKTPEVGLVSTVDYGKTADAFHNVVAWQESGKKKH